jgi:hypothetical protein
MESSKEEAILVLNGWAESKATVLVRIKSSWIDSDGFAGSIISADAECVEIAGPGLMLSVDFSSATAFTWGEEKESDAEFDPAVFESVLRFTTAHGLSFAFAASR